MATLRQARLRAGGSVVSDTPRHVALRDMLNHLAHHRGQLTVYLRLIGATVPAVYERGLTPSSVLVRRASLEDVFIELMGSNGGGQA